MRTVDDYLELPWSIVLSEHRDDGGYLAARIAELPGFVATGRTREELSRDLWDALRTHIETMMRHGDSIPVPVGVPDADHALEDRVSVEYDEGRATVRKSPASASYGGEATKYGDPATDELVYC